MRTFVCARRSDVGDCASNGVRSTKAAWSRRCLVCQWPTTPRPSTTSTARGCVIKKVKLPVPIALHHPCRSVPTQARRWFRTSTPGAGRSFAAARNGPKIDLPSCRGGAVCGRGGEGRAREVSWAYTRAGRRRARWSMARHVGESQRVAECRPAAGPEAQGRQLACPPDIGIPINKLGCRTAATG